MTEKESTLESLRGFPHIHDFIEKNWDDTELLVEYVKKLLNDTRNHERKGFPHEIAETLLVFFNNRKSTPILTEEEFRVHTGY